MPAHNPLINRTLLMMKYARVINLLAERLQIAPSRALGVFYRSQVYAQLNRLENFLHNMGDAYIVDELMLELQQQ